VDLFEGADMDDDRVLNVARLLQSFDADGNPAQGAINITEPVIACLESAMTGLPPIPEPDVFFADDYAVGELIDATIAACAGEVELTAVTKEEALENLNSGMKAGNLMKRNISKTPGMKSDKAEERQGQDRDRAGLRSGPALGWEPDRGGLPRRRRQRDRDPGRGQTDRRHLSRRDRGHRCPGRLPRRLQG
jgi:hypothetical protein